MLQVERVTLLSTAPTPGIREHRFDAVVFSGQLPNIHQIDSRKRIFLQALVLKKLQKF